MSDAGEKTVLLHSNEDSLVFEFSDGTLLAGVWNGEYLTDSDGIPLGWDEIHISVNDEPIEISNTTYCQSLCRIYFGEEETISVWYVQAFGILIYIFGIVSVLQPDEVHFFLSRWRYNNPELSEAGRLLEQISGVIFSILGIVTMSGIMLLV